MKSTITVDCNTIDDTINVKFQSRKTDRGQVTLVANLNLEEAKKLEDDIMWSIATIRDSKWRKRK
jgi:hypothetical protein